MQQHETMVIHYGIDSKIENIIEIEIIGEQLFYEQGQIDDRSSKRDSIMLRSLRFIQGTKKN